MIYSCKERLQCQVCFLLSGGQWRLAGAVVHDSAVEKRVFKDLSKACLSRSQKCDLICSFERLERLQLWCYSVDCGVAMTGLFYDQLTAVGSVARQGRMPA